jgi:dTDP-4-amino-4,6-dideoxygalactose transaminase
VFVDIDPVSYNLDVDALEAALTSRTKCIMPVHLYGQCVDMDPLWRIASRSNIPIVEDACQAIGAEFQGRRAGVLGTLACFSFFPTKNLGGAGDGGLVTSDDPVLTKRIRRLRVHGDAGQYDHIEVGLNSRLDALQAAVLRVKLRHLDKWTEARQANAHRYAMLFEEYDLLDVLTPPVTLPERRHVYNQYIVRVGDGLRDKVLQGLRERQIGCTIYYPKPLHLQTCFASLGYEPGSLPESERASKETIALPVYPELTEQSQVRVVEAIAEILGRDAKKPVTASVPRPKFLTTGAKQRLNSEG